MAKRIFLLFLVYLVAEGALRKWAFPGLSTELYLLKDALLLAALMSFFIVRNPRFSMATFFRPHESLAWGIWIAMTFAAFALSGISVTSIAGLRYYLAPLPLLLLVPLAFADAAGLQKFMWKYLALCCGVCILGIFQAISPRESVINVYAWGSDVPGEGIATFGGDFGEADAGLDFSRVRITGTFSFISPFGAYLQFMYFVAIGLFSCARKERERVFAALGIALTLANMVLTGARAPVLTSLVLSLFFINSMIRAIRQRFGWLYAGLIGLAIGVAILSGFTTMIDALVARNEAADDAADRIVGTLFMPFYTFANSDIIGAGIGETFLGIGQATAGEIVRAYNFDEVTQDRLAVEIGFVGYAFVLTMKVLFLYQAYRLSRAAVSHNIRVWALVALVYQLSLAWQIPLYNAVAATFYFFSVGLIGLLRAENERQLCRTDSLFNSSTSAFSHPSRL